MALCSSFSLFQILLHLVSECYDVSLDLLISVIIYFLFILKSVMRVISIEGICCVTKYQTFLPLSHLSVRNSLLW